MAAFAGGQPVGEVAAELNLTVRTASPYKRPLLTPRQDRRPQRRLEAIFHSAPAEIFLQMPGRPGGVLEVPYRQRKRQHPLV
jgi:hypothetical protein